MEVNFDPGQEQDVDVKLDKRAAKKKSDREKLADRAAYESLGLSVLKLKMSTYRVLKKQIEELGVKTIGHCSIIIAREKAEAVVAELDAIAKEWEESDIATDPMARISLQELKLDCIKIMINSGEAHLKSERQPSDQQPAGTIQLPFEAGMPIAVAIGRQQPEKSVSVETAEQ